MKGFTLIELIIVIVIIGILAAVAIPKYLDLQDQAQHAARDGDVGAIRSAITIYYADQAAGGSPGWPASISADLFADGNAPTSGTTGTWTWVYDSTTGTVSTN